jgi:hypothetical protein
VIPDPPPRYDEVFFEGQRWLDSLAENDVWVEDIKGKPLICRCWNGWYIVYPPYIESKVYPTLYGARMAVKNSWRGI